MNLMNRRGFTLIELLIVVAIIGILAAIAVPNFLNAQVRAKIARCHSDMQAMSTGFEMYSLDNGRYPYMGPPNLWYSEWIYPRLTTPISYLSSIPTDGFAINEFRENVHRYDGGHRNYYPGWNIFEVVKANNGQPGWGGVAVVNAVNSGSRILTVSRGPDKKEDIGGAPATGVLVYDASNGLHSTGDIYRLTPGGILTTRKTYDPNG